VVGVGGAGGNAVNNMIQSDLEGVEFLVTNADAQALSSSRSPRAIQLGSNVTQGLGAGARPDVGRRAAEESLEEIVKELQGANMAFITAGMGGGTGTGAAPVIASAARELGILTVGVVTKPFNFEGSRRARLADKGIEELSQYVDTLIVVPNQNLFRIATEKTTFADAFKMADDVLHAGVRSVTDLMIMPGLINLDFADVRTVMDGMGKAMMGTGEAEGEDRGIRAAELAIANPLLDDVSMVGAKGVLINITGGPDLGLCELDEAANRIRQEVDEDANIIFGSCFDERLEGKIRVSVVATGIGNSISAHQEELQKLANAVAEPIMKPAPSVQTAYTAPSAPTAASSPATETSAEIKDEQADEPTPPFGGPKGPNGPGGPGTAVTPKGSDADPLGLSLFDRPAGVMTPNIQLDAFIPKAPIPTKDEAATSYAPKQDQQALFDDLPEQEPEPKLEVPSKGWTETIEETPEPEKHTNVFKWSLFGKSSKEPEASKADDTVKATPSLPQPVAKPETPVNLDANVNPDVDNIPAFLRRQAN